MSNLGQVVYLSEAQKEVLFENDTITVNGTTINYSDNDIYVTPEVVDSTPTEDSINMVTSGGVYDFVTDSWDDARINGIETASLTVSGTLDASAATASVGTLTLGSNPTQNLQAATKQYVDQSFAANDAMIFKGTRNGGSTGAYGALTPAADKGHTYKVAAAGKINGVPVEVGDTLICLDDSTAEATSSNYTTIKDKWVVVQANIDGAVTGPTPPSVDNQIALFDGISARVIKNSSATIDSAGKLSLSNTGTTGSEIVGAQILAPNLTASTDNTNRFQLYLGRDTSNSYNAGVLSFVYNTNTSTSNYLALGMRGAAQTIRVYGSGNVSIGGANNNYKLSVNGTTNLSGTIYVNGSVHGSIVPDANGSYTLGNWTYNFFEGYVQKIISNTALHVRSAASIIFTQNKSDGTTNRQFGRFDSATGNLILYNEIDAANSADTAAAVSSAGGVAVKKTLAAKQVKIDNGSTTKNVSLQYNETLETLNFVFS